jgi:Putative Actinobacterial Holin-X, holin superfamily III
MLAALINAATKWIPSLLPKLVTERPDLLIDHALAYAELAKSEIQAVKRDVIRRAVAGGIALVSGLCFVMLAGVALMLHATRELRTDVSWILLVVPGVMLVLTIASTIIAMAKATKIQPVKSLTEQVRLDVQAFRAVMNERS